MARKRIPRFVVGVVALAAGLGVAGYLIAGDGDKLRPKDPPKRVAFTAPRTDEGRPAPVFYRASLLDITRGVEVIIPRLEFETVVGPIDSHVVWLPLSYNHSYKVQLRGVAADGSEGVWSEWSDLFEYLQPPPEEQ
jgi:hypothetical protein